MERVRIIFLWLAVMIVPTQKLYSDHGLDESAIRANSFTLFEENGKIGLKDQDGDVLIPADYEAIGWSNSKLSIVDKVVGYKLNGLWGLISTSNKVLTSAEFLDLRPGEGSFLVAQRMSGVSQRPSFGVINTSGKTVIPFLYDSLRLSNMRAIVMLQAGTKYRFGLADLSNKLLIPIEHQRIYSLGSLRYAVENYESKTAIFSDEGQQLSPFNIDSISNFRKDYAILYQNQFQGLIDRNGRVVLDPIYGAIRLHEGGAVQFRQSDSWLLLSGENKLLNEHRADGVRPLSENHYAVLKGGKVQLTNNSFQPLHKSCFSFLGDFENGNILYKTSSKSGLMNAAGKILIPAQYRQLVKDGNFFRASLDIGHKNRWVLLDQRGNKVTEKLYEEIGAFNGTIYPVRNRGHWGALNASGKEIISCVHDSLIQSSGNHVVVKFKGEYGIINLSENWVVTPKDNPLEILGNGMYFEFAGQTTFLKAMPGEVIYFSNNILQYDNGYIRELLPSGAHWTINMNGIIIDRSRQPDNTEKVFPQSEGFRAIRKDGKYGFIDNEGRLRIANRYEEAKPFSNGLAAIRIRSKWGFIDRHEKLVVQPVYDEVASFSNGHAIVTRGNLSGLVDENGKIVLPVRYDKISRNDQERYLLRQGDLYGLADASGKIIIHPKYHQISDTGSGYVIVERDDQYGLLTLHGVSTIPMIYDSLTFDPYHRQFMAVKRSPWQNFAAPAQANDKK